MADIITQRQQTRRNKINAIKGLLEAALNAGTKIEYKPLVLEAMSQLLVSRRYAVEYISVAMHEMNLNKADLEARNNKIERGVATDCLTQTTLKA